MPIKKSRPEIPRPRTPAQVENIRTELNELLDIISRKDAEGMHAYLSKIRKNIK